MIFTAARPPVIRFNGGKHLGFIPQFNLVDISGNLVSLTNPNMTQVNNTTMWYYKVGDNMVVPNTYTEYTYFISSGAGYILEDGNFTIEDNNTSLSGAVVYKDIDIKPFIILPGSISIVKQYPIRFVPRAADNTFVEGVKEVGGAPALGPNININFQNPLNSSHNFIANMSLGTEEWIYYWPVAYNTPLDLVLITIQCQSNGKGYKFSELIEVIKAKDFNPQRLSVGGVG